MGEIQEQGSVIVGPDPTIHNTHNLVIAVLRHGNPWSFKKQVDYPVKLGNDKKRENKMDYPIKHALWLDQGVG